MAGIRSSARNKAERNLSSIYASEKEMDEIIDRDKPKEKAEGEEMECKSCKQKGNCMTCEICEHGECQSCTKHGNLERKKIKKALELTGILWTCQECNKEVKREWEAEKGGCGSCDKPLSDFYMNCDYCKEWLCEKCLGEKEEWKKASYFY